MNSVPLQSVFNGIATLLGAGPVDLGSPDHLAFVDALNLHIPRGWRYDFWPEWSPTELRAFREEWRQTETYAAGTEVFFAGDDKYYTANSAPNTPALGESPLAYPAKWTELTDFAPIVPLVATGKSTIAEVDYVCRRDPKKYPRTRGELEFEIVDGGVLVLGGRMGIPPRVWVKLRKPAPKFSAEFYNAERTYLAGQRCCDEETGETYRALQTTTGNGPTALTYWAHEACPEILEPYLRVAAYAVALRGDGQTAKAMTEDGNALNHLLSAWEAAFPGQSQSETADYRTS